MKQFATPRSPQSPWGVTQPLIALAIPLRIEDERCDECRATDIASPAAQRSFRPHPRTRQEKRNRESSGDWPPGFQAIRLTLPSVFRQLCRLDDATVVVIDLEGLRFHFHTHVILFSWVFWYSPRVRTGETSAILEAAGIDNFALFRGDCECRFARPVAIYVQVRTDLISIADQRHAE